MSRFLTAGAIALLPLLSPLAAAADDAKATCDKVLATLTKLAADSGEPALPDAARQAFQDECVKWPEDLRGCFADASGEEAIGACMAKAMQLDMEKAKGETGAAQVAAADGPTPTGAKTAPAYTPPMCDDALKTMSRINKELGEKDPTPEQVTQFLQMCGEFSVEVRKCMVSAADKKAMEGCIEMMVKEALEKQEKEGKAQPQEGGEAP